MYIFKACLRTINVNLEYLLSESSRFVRPSVVFQLLTRFIWEADFSTHKEVCLLISLVRKR